MQPEPIPGSLAGAGDEEERMSDTDSHAAAEPREVELKLDCAGPDLTALASHPRLKDTSATEPESLVTTYYDTPDRAETWTMRHHDGQAMIDVQSARGVVRYLGTATDGATLQLDVSTTTGRVQLDCKRTTRKIGTGCRDRKPAARDVLDCYVEGFTEPMPFAPDPGVAYVATSDCTGYQLIPKGD